MAPPTSNKKYINKKNKYGAIKTWVDDICFGSKGEARRYEELKLLERFGEIADLRVHTRFPIVVNGHAIGFYVDDFDYTDTAKNVWVVEDFKGMQTSLSKWKIALFEALYGIKVKIVKKK